MGKGSLYDEQCWDNWITTRRRIEVHPSLIPLTKINLKWTKDLNVTPETIKLPDDNTGKKFLDIGLGKDIFGCDTKNKNKQVGLCLTKKKKQSAK